MVTVKWLVVTVILVGSPVCDGSNSHVAQGVAATKGASPRLNSRSGLHRIAAAIGPLNLTQRGTG